jgi:predicted acylesterase/phospholipase RssA
VGLALAGGGPLGGIYKVGALIALADSLAGIDLNDIDVYVGVSSGGFVAAALANGISPTQMYRLFIDDGAEASYRQRFFCDRRSASLPAAAGPFPACLLLPHWPRFARRIGAT